MAAIPHVKCDEGSDRENNTSYIYRYIYIYIYIYIYYIYIYQVQQVVFCEIISDGKDLSIACWK